MNHDNKKRGGSRLDVTGKTAGSEVVTGTQQSKKKHRIAIIIVAVTAAVLLGLFALYKSWARLPELPFTPVATVNPDTGETPVIENVNRKKEFYTFLILGRDTGGGGNTDTIMLAAYDIPNQKLSVMSIPRDTMVNVSWDIKKINSVYNVNGGGDKGIAALKKEVSQLIGFEPDYQIVVEWEGFGALVDAIGGVEFDVPINMNYDDPTQDLHIHIKKGLQHLDGEQAMGVIRFRDGNNNTGYTMGDLGRIETQQAFMLEVVAQCMQIKNITRIQELAQVFTDYVETNLTVGNLVAFGERAILGGLSMSKVNFSTMPYQGASAWSRSVGQKLSYVVAKPEELLTIINADFNPYLKPAVLSDLDIMSVNSNGTLSSTTGVVEDKKAAKS